MDTNIILTTLENIPNTDIEEHMGLVSGAAIIKGNTFKSLISYFKNFFGGEIVELDAAFEKARQEAIKKMSEEVINRNANAVISIRFDCLRLANGYCEVHVYGSAVKLSSF